MAAWRKTGQTEIDGLILHILVNTADNGDRLVRVFDDTGCLVHTERPPAIVWANHSNGVRLLPLIAGHAAMVVRLRKANAFLRMQKPVSQTGIAVMEDTGPGDIWDDDP